jgi:hypothetical protein
VTTESPRWFKSSYSNNGGACVEVAANLIASNGVVPVRDSKDPNGPTLTFPTTTWTAFVTALKSGDLPTTLWSTLAVTGRSQQAAGPWNETLRFGGPSGR